MAFSSVWCFYFFFFPFETFFWLIIKKRKERRTIFSGLSTYFFSLPVWLTDA